MAKAKFERTKPHCNIGTIGQISLISIKLQKKENVVSQFLQHTLSMKQSIDIMHTLTAQAMLTTLRT